MRSEKLLGGPGILSSQLRHKLLFRTPSVCLLLNAPGEPRGDVGGPLRPDILDNERAHPIGMHSRVHLDDASTSRISEQDEAAQSALLHECLEILDVILDEVRAVRMPG